jgi:hypothetical protein
VEVTKMPIDVITDSATGYLQQHRQNGIEKNFSVTGTDKQYVESALNKLIEGDLVLSKNLYDNKGQYTASATVLIDRKKIAGPVSDNRVIEIGYNK